METHQTPESTETPHRRPTVPRKSPTVSDDRGEKFEISVTILKSQEELYRFWRRLENLPLLLKQLVSVKAMGEGRTRWTMRTSDDREIQWTSEIIEDRPNEMIAWRTSEDSDVQHAGSIWFRPAPGDRGTEVRIIMKYDVPGGKLSVTLMKFSGEGPSQQARELLLHLKQLVETGEIATTVGQPTGNGPTTHKH